MTDPDAPKMLLKVNIPAVMLHRLRNSFVHRRTKSIKTAEEIHETMTKLDEYSPPVNADFYTFDYFVEQVLWMGLRRIDGDNGWPT